MTKRRTPQQYEELLLEREIDFWPKQEYISSHVPILHECINGHEFMARPVHILNGSGCKICSGKKDDSASYSAKIAHKGITIEESYTDSRTKLLHKCSLGHTWTAFPNVVANKSGCPVCNVGGINPEKPAICYYIKIGSYYKIGITGRSVEERFKSDKDKPLSIIATRQFSTAREARQFEQILLSKVVRATDSNYLNSGGNTELFRDPLHDSDIQGFSETSVSAVPAAKL